RHPADAHAPRRARRAHEAQPGEGGRLFAVQQSRRGAVSFPTGEYSRRAAALHGRRHPEGEGSLRTVRRYDRAPAGGEQMIPELGIPPTPTHLAELVERMKRSPAKAVVYSPYNNPGAAQFLSQRANIPVVPLPFTVGGTPKAKDLFGLFDDTIERLLAANK